MIKKEPKPILEGKIFTCERHEGTQLTRHCLMDDEYFCLECLEDHYDHDPKKNISKHSEATIKQKIQGIIDQIQPKNKEQIEFIEGL